MYAYSAPALREGRGGAVHHPNTELKGTAKVFADCIESNPTARFSSFNAEPADADVIFSVDAAGQDGMGGFELPNQPHNAAEPPKAYHAPWPPGFAQGNDGVSSGLQETLTIAALAHHHPVAGQHLHFWSDSAVAVDATGRGRSDSPALNRTLALLFATCAARSLTITVAWHRRGNNGAALAADALSRGLFDQAEALFPAIAGASRMTFSTQDCPVFATKPNVTTTAR